MIFSKDGNQIWSLLKERLVLICADHCQSVQPFLWRATMIELCFLLFCGNADLMFDLLVTHDHEVPGLQVGPIGGGTCGEQTFLDDLSWNGSIRKVPYGVASLHILAEG